MLHAKRIITEQSALYNTPYPSLIKYMGSKSKIMDFVIDGINKAYQGGTILDLFAGSASLSGALGQQCTVHSNDIQNYSRILAETYNSAYSTNKMPSALELVHSAQELLCNNRLALYFDYKDISDIKDFVLLEEKQRGLIHQDFSYEWHLFAKNYSGTWWSYEQCLWIDAIRQIAEAYKKQPFYPMILSSLIFAMAYASQGTGHYAQYRDAKTKSSLKDISIYRKRSLADYFTRKYNELSNFIPKNKPLIKHTSSALDYKDCLTNFEGGTVYADPPYCFVHYSRFYHAIETLVLYDFPDLQIQRGSIVKGRYRDNRHQSPFCIKSQVPMAFDNLFSGVNQSSSNLVLSYSNTGMISITDILDIATSHFPDRKIETVSIDHKHMTLGRKQDRHRDVKECLIIVK